MAEIIVALDTPGTKQAREIVDCLGEECSFYKIGLQLAFVGGIGLAIALKRQGKRVFLDLKLTDIPSTVGKATRDLLRLVEPDLLTVTGDLKTLQAAVDSCGDTQVLRVTLLTSESADDRQVIKLSREAAAVGAGVVASGREARAIREACADLLIVSPGIRLATDSPDEHQRYSTPKEAAGSNYLVVGRPITNAPNPLSAYRRYSVMEG